MAAIDKEVSGVAHGTAARWRHGDAENAINYWVQKIFTHLIELRGRATAQNSSRNSAL
jgi:hypothetical protein